MNKKFSKGLLFLCFLQLLSLSGYPQNLNVEINLPENDSSVIEMSGSFSSEISERNLLFLLSYADSDNLGSRIGGPSLFDRSGQKIGFKKIADGSYIADRPFSSFSYRVNAAFPKNIPSSAHISWVSGEKGILRLNDLLPLFENKYNTSVSLKLPEGWMISTVEKTIDQNSFSIKKPENAVFVVGKGWTSRSFIVSQARVNLAVDNQWKVESSAVEQIIRDIVGKYEDYFGEIPAKHLNVINLRFPESTGFDRWRAETSGANIVVMSAPTVFESRLRQRIQEQMRHEFFHLWMPNNLALKGDYSWFYEGFAQYTALRAGVELNQITFNDFLNTLEQAYNFGNRRSQPVSLIEASKNRWFIEDSSVYAKGLAVAFLFDVALLRQSGGKRDLLSVLRQIYEKHKLPNKMLEANGALLEFLEDYPELAPIINDYVKGKARLNFERFLGRTGIETQASGDFINLMVSSNLSRREKDFLDKLGYNNWRKFLSK